MKKPIEREKSSKEAHKTGLVLRKLEAVDCEIAPRQYVGTDITRDRHFANGYDKGMEKQGFPFKITAVSTQDRALMAIPKFCSRSFRSFFGGVLTWSDTGTGHPKVMATPVEAARSQNHRPADRFASRAPQPTGVDERGKRYLIAQHGSDFFHEIEADYGRVQSGPNTDSGAARSDAMSRPSAAVAWQRAGRPDRQRGIRHDPSATQRPIAYETLLNSAPIAKARRFSTAC
ncbi:hypothetical protein [Burkholderia sp. Bp8986]|uniref:hypothetical protein n=1 Tax=Burkholderia sp. Bp8986 TaxID=2184550 RepID=UPI00163AE667|nr:hypothetical protein [Burkholderia sp. Bp8986]